MFAGSGPTSSSTPNPATGCPRIAGATPTSTCRTQVCAGEIPTLRCVMPTREQRELPTDIQVMRTVAKHANRCLGIYATVSSPGTIGVGDEIVVGCLPHRPALPP